MSIYKTNEVDTIGINDETGKVNLSIIDELDWENEEKHLRLLQDKINTYLSFIESDEIYDSYPDAKDRNFEIKIYFRCDIPEIAYTFLKQASNIIKDAGFYISWEIYNGNVI